MHIKQAAAAMNGTGAFRCEWPCSIVRATISNIAYLGTRRNLASFGKKHFLLSPQERSRVPQEEASILQHAMMVPLLRLLLLLLLFIENGHHGFLGLLENSSAKPTQSWIRIQQLIWSYLKIKPSL